MMQPLKQFWSNTSPAAKKLMAMVIVVLLIVALSGSLFLNNKNYVIIFDQLTSSESTEILAQLQTMDVSVKVDKNNAILVPAKDESRIRMALATQGYPKSGLSYYLIEQGSGMLSTDYDRKVYANIQLQERIAASIKTLDGVKDAIVTITIPTDNVFYLQENSEPASASVIIHMIRGNILTESQVVGIQNLVAKSVAGLSKDNIAISDGQGTDLVDTSVGSSNPDFLKVSLTKEIEAEIRNKVLSVLEGPYDRSKIRVSVSATIDTNNLITEQTTYTPAAAGTNTGVASSTTSNSETSGSNTAGGVAGTSSNALPTYASTTSGAGVGAYSSTSTNSTYQVSQSKAQTEKVGPIIEAISIGIAVDKASFGPGEQQSITQLVAFATGVDPAMVSVQNFAFFQSDAVVVPPEVAVKDNMQLIILAGGGAGLLILIIIIVLIVLKSRGKKSKKRMPATKEESLDELFGEVKAEQVRHIPPKNDARKQEIQDFSKANPEIAAQLIKTWLRTEQD